MRPEFKAFVLVLLAISTPTVAYASEEGCTISQDNMASTALAASKSLVELYAVSKRFRGCVGDGGTAEELSDDVVVRLARHWHQSISEVARHEAHSGFVSFVLNHIDATTDWDDLVTISKNSRSKCPSNSKAICHKIGASAASALKEAAEAVKE